MDKNWSWILVIALLVIIVTVFIISNKPGIENAEKTQCTDNSDCVPADCCHSSTCINIEFKEPCNNITCSQECSSPLDCGAGQCECIDGICFVTYNLSET